MGSESSRQQGEEDTSKKDNKETRTEISPQSANRTSRSNTNGQLTGTSRTSLLHGASSRVSRPNPSTNSREELVDKLMKSHECFLGSVPQSADGSSRPNRSRAEVGAASTIRDMNGQQPTSKTSSPNGSSSRVSNLSVKSTRDELLEKEIGSQLEGFLRSTPHSHDGSSKPTKGQQYTGSSKTSAPQEASSRVSNPSTKTRDELLERAMQSQFKDFLRNSEPTHDDSSRPTKAHMELRPASTRRDITGQQHTSRTSAPQEASSRVSNPSTKTRDELLERAMQSQFKDHFLRNSEPTHDDSSRPTKAHMELRPASTRRDITGRQHTSRTFSPQDASSIVVDPPAKSRKELLEKLMKHQEHRSSPVSNLHNNGSSLTRAQAASTSRLCDTTDQTLERDTANTGTLLGQKTVDKVMDDSALKAIKQERMDYRALLRNDISNSSSLQANLAADTAARSNVAPRSISKNVKHDRKQVDDFVLNDLALVSNSTLSKSSLHGRTGPIAGLGMVSDSVNHMHSTENASPSGSTSVMRELKMTEKDSTYLLEQETGPKVPFNGNEGIKDVMPHLAKTPVRNKNMVENTDLIGPNSTVFKHEISFVPLTKERGRNSLDVLTDDSLKSGNGPMNKTDVEDSLAASMFFGMQDTGPPKAIDQTGGKEKAPDLQRLRTWEVEVGQPSIYTRKSAMALDFGYAGRDAVDDQCHNTGEMDFKNKSVVKQTDMADNVESNGLLTEKHALMEWEGEKNTSAMEANKTDSKVECLSDARTKEVVKASAEETCANGSKTCSSLDAKPHDDMEHSNPASSVSVVVGTAVDQSGATLLPESNGTETNAATPKKKKQTRARSKQSAKARNDKQNVAINVNCDVKKIGHRQVKQYFTRIFKEKVKFRLGKMEKRHHLFAVQIELESREEAEEALAYLKSSDRNVIKDYEIDLLLKKCSDLNYDLQIKSCPELEEHGRRIGEEHQKLMFLIPSEETILTKGDLNNIMFERINVEQKLMELTRQGNEFVSFMTSVSSRLIGQETISSTEAKLIRQSFGIECSRLKQALPMYARRRDIVKTVWSGQVTIVLGETGSGKSTQIVQYLYQSGFASNDELIACTQPRKVAAISLAERVSEEMRSHIGSIVGYKSGNRGRFGGDTRILYMTDYNLLLELVRDPALSNYSCVVIDEAHERSLYTDILLGMLKKLLVERKELRVIISSATMDTELFREYFNDFKPVVLKISGRMFPVEVVWPNKNWKGLSKFPVQDTVNLVKEIHRKEERGDVLVFVTTPAETEKACETLSQFAGLECMPLHGKLQPQEQKKVFQPAADGKRKVVFATNCAETSITISGIKYVIDTGLVKENKYDPIRNMSTLDVGKTSRSSVEQRKGRAGRVEAGKCFRLFTEEDFTKMESSNKPEILRVQLGHAILSLMSAGVRNPLQFDFVQSPGKDALEAAMAELVSIGAVVDGSLTDMGRKISKLQLNPKLGKLVVEGIEQDIAMEAMVVASVCTLSGSMFFRVGSDEEKEKADIRKLQFCHPAGDLLTCLDVYREWKDIDERRKNKWCFDKSINAKAMRIIKETLMDLMRTLEREPGVQMNQAFKENREEADRKIQQAIFYCFSSNLCRFAGHHRVGYLSCQEGGEKAGALHPSSALCYLDEKPKWLVYDSILKTSQEYILNVTTVEDSWVTEAIETGQLHIDMQQLEDKVLTKARMAEFGYLVMKKLTENKYTLCNTLQKQMSRIFESPVVLDITMAPCVLDIIAKKKFHGRIKDIIRENVAQEKEAIKSKEIEVACNQTSTRLVFGNGYQVKLVLAEDEYRSILVKIDTSVYCDMSAQEIIDSFSVFGEIKDHFTFKKQNPNQRDHTVRWGKITFASIEQAADAVEQTENEAVFAVPDLQQGRSRKRNQSDYIIKFKYCRRLSKGSGFIRFQEPDDAIRAIDYVHSRVLVGNSYANLRHDLRDNNLTKVNINQIDVAVGEDELKEAVHGALRDYSESVVEVVLFREKGCDSKPQTPVELDEFKQRMKSSIDRFVPPSRRDQYRIHILPPRSPGTVYLIGSMYFNTLDVFEMVERGLHGGHKCFIGSIDRAFAVSYHITSSFSVPKAMYDVIKTCFEEVHSDLQELHEEEMTVKIETYGDIVRISLTSDDASLHKQAIKLYQEVMDGDTFPANTSLMDVLFTATAEKELKHIMALSKAYVAVDKRTRTISIYGREVARTRAKIDLNNLLGDVENNQPKSIHLRDEKQPKGLMKKVVKTFGCDLEEVRAMPGITAAVFDMRRRLLKIQGSIDALDAVSQRVKELADEIDADPNPAADEDEIACSICFDTFEADYKNMYRLQVCGHEYCLECLKRQIDYSQTSKEFPILCSGENCEEPMTLLDIWKIYPKQQEDVHTKLQMASLEAFVSQNRLEYRFCPTPNCRGIYRVTNDENAVSEFRCEMCMSINCTCCHKQHPGFSCKGLTDDDEINRVWQQKDPNNRKLCPTCKTRIEKSGGCNHFKCLSCKAEFCWLCLAVFGTSGECYEHLTKVHGGWGI